MAQDGRGPEVQVVDLAEDELQLKVRLARALKVGCAALQGAVELPLGTQELLVLAAVGIDDLEGLRELVVEALREGEEAPSETGQVRQPILLGLSLPLRRQGRDSRENRNELRCISNTGHPDLKREVPHTGNDHVELRCNRAHEHLHTVVVVACELVEATEHSQVLLFVRVLAPTAADDLLQLPQHILRRHLDHLRGIKGLVQPASLHVASRLLKRHLGKLQLLGTCSQRLLQFLPQRIERLRIRPVHLLLLLGTQPICSRFDIPKRLVHALGDQPRILGHQLSAPIILYESTIRGYSHFSLVYHY